jgi:glyoxylase-like metal-dependent hydrolase (beta-lactamase superfamily II)
MMMMMMMMMMITIMMLVIVRGSCPLPLLPLPQQSSLAGQDPAFRPGYHGSGEGVEVVIVDTGCDSQHQEFAHLKKPVIREVAQAVGEGVEDGASWR